MANHDLSQPLEDYLEAIARLERECGGARTRDIAQAMSVHKSTVTAALHTLSGRGLVNYEPYEVTTLTEQGKAVAGEIERRHELLEQFLTAVLAVSPECAADNACRIEHAVDATVTERISQLMRFSEQQPEPFRAWADEFRHYCEAESI